MERISMFDQFAGHHGCSEFAEHWRSEPPVSMNRPNVIPFESERTCRHEALEPPQGHRVSPHSAMLRAFCSGRNFLR
jgi:hypothetical protein